MGTLTYITLNTLVLLAVGAVSYRAYTRSRQPFWSALAGLLLLTLIFDNILIALSVYAYAPETHVGILLGLAPLEDFYYPVVSMLLIVTLWSTLERPPSKKKE